MEISCSTRAVYLVSIFSDLKRPGKDRELNQSWIRLYASIENLGLISRFSFILKDYSPVRYHTTKYLP